MKKKEKGQPGYIRWRKEKYLIGTIAEFAVVIALVVLGYVQTKTKLNLLTVVAVVGVFRHQRCWSNLLPLHHIRV